MKTYQAETLQDAFRAIKAELGPDAVILDTTHARTGRTVRHPFGRPIVRVRAAVDQASRRRAAGSRGASDASLVSVPSVRPSRGGTTDVFERVLASSLRDHDVREGRPSSFEDGDEEGAADAPGDGRMVAAAAPARVRAELEDRGCDPRTASSLVAEAVAEAAGRRSLSDATLRTALYAVVTRRLRERTALGGRDERGRCVALIGPTGAGKTLALSKLMAQHLQRGSSGVTVVKMESKRSPGIDPLQVTAAELGALVHVARSRRELAAVIAQRSASDVMLVDTPGMSGLDRGAVGRVREWCSTEVPLEVHLVLPASMIRQDFDELLLGYAGLPIHRLLFTKIDETVRHGRMLEIALRSTLPLSYLAEGQDPRHGIEVATPDRVAGLVCRGDAGAVDDIASDLEREEEPACGAWMGGAGRHAVRTPGTTFEGGVEWNRP